MHMRTNWRKWFCKADETALKAFLFSFFKFPIAFFSLKSLYFYCTINLMENLLRFLSCFGFVTWYTNFYGECVKCQLRSSYLRRWWENRRMPVRALYGLRPRKLLVSCSLWLLFVLALLLLLFVDLFCSLLASIALP